ncbi:hypothetical protein B0H19DRAFT_365737 [Mycena capillaripes]|nr:hypothetical protein B0H19DRAFT_365737 [Mycena capillaripes]
MIASLPVELIAKIVAELTLQDVIKISQLSRRLKLVASDPVLNIWRLPILRNLCSDEYEGSFKHLSVYMSVPRHNWVEILSMGRASYILFETTLPNLKEAEWEEAFKRFVCISCRRIASIQPKLPTIRRRFLPSWRKWRRDSPWKAAFLRLLFRVWHRSSVSHCTTDEAWTKYIVLNRNGSANQLEASSRNFNPTVILDHMRLQQNMLQLEMRTRLVVQFADVRILALGTTNRPLSPLTVNANAKAFLCPPGIDHDTTDPIPQYSRLKYPLPARTHINYPLYTPGGEDTRWVIPEDLEAGLQWVGGLVIVAQIFGPETNGTSPDNGPPLQDGDLLVGPGRQPYGSFVWEDLWAIAPWLEEKITRQIDGPGLGL